jgi:hypothetical protein
MYREAVMIKSKVLDMFFSLMGILLFSLMKKVTKKSSLKIKSLKTGLMAYLTATGSPPFNFKCCFPILFI